jgi:hypothetical protein
MPRRLDLDNSSAEIAQNGRAEWTVQDVCQIDDEQAREGTVHFFGFRGWHLQILSSEKQVGASDRTSKSSGPQANLIELTLWLVPCSTRVVGITRIQTRLGNYLVPSAGIPSKGAI